MSETYTKLFSSITASTVWGEAYPTRIVWVTLLAMVDASGDVYASLPGLARAANVTREECDAAIASFLAPDPDSRTSTNDGRRIEAIDGGWRLINHAKYAAIRDEAERRDYKRQWDRENRPSGHTRQSDNSPTQSDKSDNSPTNPKIPTAPTTPALTPTLKETRSKEVAPSPAGSSHECVIELPLNDGSQFEITAEHLREFSGLYPAISVEQSLRDMRGWCIGNPKNRKTRAGILRFVTTWLSREHDRRRPLNGNFHNAPHRESAADRVARINAEAERRDVIEGNCVATA